ncbi:hypothetical protein LJC27_05500, partial [Christensenellaceae bacterium OttesenSCG-928-M15]|nr:hypothetical protein [Christensenellaceae bacterium OttesenSCG-928-M15]
LLNKVEQTLVQAQVRIELVVPYHRYDAMGLIHSSGRILQEEHMEDGAHILAMIDESALWKIKEALKA